MAIYNYNILKIRIEKKSNVVSTNDEFVYHINMNYIMINNYIVKNIRIYYSKKHKNIL